MMHIKKFIFCHSKSSEQFFCHNRNDHINLLQLKKRLVLAEENCLALADISLYMKYK